MSATTAPTKDAVLDQQIALSIAQEALQTAQNEVASARARLGTMVLQYNKENPKDAFILPGVPQRGPSVGP